MPMDQVQPSTNPDQKSLPKMPMDRVQPSTSPDQKSPTVLSIECLKGTSTADEWTGDFLQTGDIVEELRIGNSGRFKSPFKNGKSGVQKVLHESFKKKETSILVRVRRGVDEFAELQACIVPNDSQKKQYMLRSIADPNYAVGFLDRSESDCLQLQASRSARMVNELSRTQLQDGYVSYRWEKRMQEFLSVPFSSCFLSILLLPKASDQGASHYNDLEDTLARANAWLHASQASGVPIVFMNVQTESLLTKISEKTASSTVNAGSLSDSSNLANASLYGFEEYHGVDIGVVRAVRLWYASLGGEFAIEIKLREDDTKLGFAISRTEEGFIFISSVIDDDENAPSTRSGLHNLYKEATNSSRLLVVSKVANQKVLPWIVSSTGAIRCFDTVSLSQKLSLHRHAKVPITIHVLLWDRALAVPSGANRSRAATPSVMQLPPEVQLSRLPDENQIQLLPPEVPSGSSRVVGDHGPEIRLERDTAGESSFRFHDFAFASNWNGERIGKSSSRKKCVRRRVKRVSKDNEPVIETFQKALLEHHNPDTLKKLNNAEKAKWELEQQEYFDTKLANEEHGKEEKTEDEVASEPHGMVIDVKEVKMTNSSRQKKFESEEIGNEASSQLRQPEGIQVEEMQLQASSTLKPQGVVFDVEAVKILKSSEMEAEASEQHGLFLMQGGLGLTKLPKDEDWKNAKEIYLMDSELSDLPENPRCPNLSALFLPRNYKLRMIPQPFFNFMPALQILNLSRTGIKYLPDSLIRLVSLKRLFLNDCHRLMILSPKVGDLKQLEVLDLEGANIMDLPKDIKNLTNLTCLEVSFYGCTSNGRRTMQSNAVVPCGVISALSQLEELNIDVNPDDKRWDACVEDIVNEVCTLKRLETLNFYFPRVELLSHIQWNSPSLSNFRFTVGHHVKRIMSRVPPDAEFELERWQRCLKYINGVGVHRDIKNVLQHVTAFFLDRHATIKKLSDFETRNMKQLKCCVVGECNELQVIIDAADAYGEDGISEIVSETYDDGRIVLGSLEHLYIYYMKSLRSIWEGPVQQNSLFLLKSLTLSTCPQLTTIFTQGLLDNLCNLGELKVEYCHSIKSIVSCEISAEHGTSYFLPNLKKISLHCVPGLVSISNGLHIAPKLEWLSFYNCPNLKNPLIDEVSCQDLKKIKGERSWWEALEWSNGCPGYLDEIFVPIEARDF